VIYLSPPFVDRYDDLPVMLLVFFFLHSSFTHISGFTNNLPSRRYDLTTICFIRADPPPVMTL